MNIFSDPLIIIVLASIIAIVLVIVFAMKFFDPMRKKMKGIGGKINRKGEGVFTVDGQTVAMQYFSGEGGPWFKISASGTFGSQLMIRPETSRDKFYKKIGLNKEVQVSDTEIDKGLFFECDTPEFTKQLFLSPQVKPLVSKILSYFNSIEITHDKCAFKRFPCEKLNKINNDIIMDSARKLLNFVSFIPRSISSYHPEALSFKAWRAILYFIGYGILICGGICVFWANISFRVIDDMRLWLLSIPIDFALFVIILYLAFQKIKGFSTSSKVLIHFIFSFGIGIVLLGRYGFAVANGILDKTPPQKFEQALIDKYTTTGENSTTYHAVVAPWHSASRSWGFTVSQAEYGRIQVGKTYYMIVTKSGRFGFEWVLSERLIR